MAPQQMIWHGTQEESYLLTNAVARNCACVYGMHGVRTATCSPHQMLLTDQRALNGLLFYRRIAKDLQREEYLLPKVEGTASGSKERR